MADGTLYRDMAPMRGDHLLDDIQPQAGAPRFGGIERFKNPGGVLGGNAAAGITDGEQGRRVLSVPRSVSVPPWGMASSALCTRFRRARRSVLRCTATRPTVSSPSQQNVTLRAAASRAHSHAQSWTIVPSSCGVSVLWLTRTSDK